MNFKSLLNRAVSFHGHLCVGQVMGVKMAMAGLRELGMANPSKRNDLVVFVEIDRCIADAIQIVTGCTIGQRRLKLVNYGKFAATFVDISNGRAVRITSKKDARNSAMEFAKRTRLIKQGEQLKEFSEREKDVIVKAYSDMPDEDLIIIDKVKVSIPKEELPGRPMHIVACTSCGEQIFDHKEIVRGGQVLCKPCASGAYYGR